jgi:hypothetical protein
MRECLQDVDVAGLTSGHDGGEDTGERAEEEQDPEGRVGKREHEALAAERPGDQDAEEHAYADPAPRRGGNGLQDAAVGADGMPARAEGDPVELRRSLRAASASSS